jgi:protoporphyrin/coproporphyrin ferrochelatase
VHDRLRPGIGTRSFRFPGSSSTRRERRAAAAAPKPSDPKFRVLIHSPGRASHRRRGANAPIPMRYLSEPPYPHGSAQRIGILLVNLGTPAAPTAAAVRPYLRQFLSDPRVVEIPRALWWAVLNGIILNVRPRKSAEKYAKIWTDEGSPLMVHTRTQAELLRAWLATRLDCPFVVEWSMRYGEPSVQAGLRRMREQGCDRVAVIPLYPQYAASTTASTYDAVFKAIGRMRNAPAIRLLKHFHDDPGYIGALAASVEEHWRSHGRPEKLVMSFHGLPRFSLERGDPYHCECQKTGRLLAEALALAPHQYVVTFQSRFGRAEWLQPYTMDTVAELGRGKAARIDVVCPGFVSDCLETLEEIALENKAAYQGAGGGEFHYIACLNERPDWIAALGAIVQQELRGWAHAEEPAKSAAAASRARALAMGARD